MWVFHIYLSTDVLLYSPDTYVLVYLLPLAMPWHLGRVALIQTFYNKQVSALYWYGTHPSERSGAI